jgi:chromate transport protein ChrA
LGIERIVMRADPQAHLGAYWAKSGLIAEAVPEIGKSLDNKGRLKYCALVLTVFDSLLARFTTAHVLLI